MPAASPVVAIVQMTSGIDPGANLAAMDAALAEAAAAGAVMAFFPEMSVLLDRDRTRSAPHIVREADSPWLVGLQDMSRRHGLWVHAGSMPLLSDDGARRVNRSLVIGSDGSIHARYDKIHMFDVTLPSGESWRESAAFEGGRAPVVVDTPVGRLGLSICYDLRFPELYRVLVEEGATILAVPAAFTVSTGEAHWHVLLRARAIETACLVIAAAQGGDHADGRATYGHSLAVDPWGTVLADLPVSKAHKPFALALVAIEQNAVDSARQAIPLATSRSNRNLDL